MYTFVYNCILLYTKVCIMCDKIKMQMRTQSVPFNYIELINNTLKNH